MSQPSLPGFYVHRPQGARDQAPPPTSPTKRERRAASAAYAADPNQTELIRLCLEQKNRKQKPNEGNP